jgi:hypothetical protein
MMKLLLGVILTAIAVFGIDSGVSDLDSVVLFAVGAYLIITSKKAEQSTPPVVGS